MYTEYKHGHVTYAEWTSKIEKLYRDRGLATKSRITEVLQQFELRHDAKSTISELQERGYKIVIISGSFDITIEHAAKLLHIQTYRAGTQIIFNDDNVFSHFINNGDEAQNKLVQLTEICDSENILLTDCVCVGDGANDIELFKATQNGICFTNGTDEVKSFAKYQIDSLSNLLNILQ